MTNKDAIEIIDNILRYERTKHKLDSEDVDRLEEAKLVIRKQIPKKPRIERSICKGIDFEKFLCPYCDKLIFFKLDDDFAGIKKQKNCPECEQALDWSEVEEKG